MLSSYLRSRATRWFLCVATGLAVSACGGSKDPILGLNDGTALTPSVSATTPLAQDPAVGGVPINTLVTATFNTAMNPETLNASTFALACPDGQTVSALVSYSAVSRVATLTPEAYLPLATRCVATVSTGAQDTHGMPLAHAFVWSFDTGMASDTTPPAVSLLNPAWNAVGVCLNKTLQVTFSEPMAALSVSSATMTLAPANSLDTPVLAVVRYDADTLMASLDPVANLAASTLYTATVVAGADGVKDLAGQALWVNQVWQFTTGSSECQEPLVLGAAANFAILGSAAITNIPTSAITGDVGLTPDTGANITGFSAPESCPEVVGRIYAVNGAGPACAVTDTTLLSLAKTDALAAFVNATGAARGTPTPINTNLAGLTLYPGLYESGTSIDLSAGGALTLDAQGDPNAVFVIRSATSITTLSTSQVVLSGGAKASRVYWTAGSAITLGVHSVMQGSLLAGTAITLQTGAHLQGRALNQGAAAAAISCDACTITLPLP